MQVDDFTPVIFLEGVLDNGTDLALPANLTSDRRALLATTPLYGQPLAPGNHSVLVSLNGQQLSAKLASREAVVCACRCAWHLSNLCARAGVTSMYAFVRSPVDTNSPCCCQACMHMQDCMHDMRDCSVEGLAMLPM